MTLEEIINEKNWWYLKEYIYILDNDWINEFKQPAPYPAFIWWNQYTFRTPRLYFRVAIRERTKEQRNKIFKTNIGKSLYKLKYDVIIKGAISGVPLPIKIWEQEGEPWKGGTNQYINCFYFGEKYKDLETQYVGKQSGISSTLIKGFKFLKEAEEFAEMWKIKIIEDHRKQIEIEKEIMKLISK